MDLEKPTTCQEPAAADRHGPPDRKDTHAEGCLVVAIRLPVRIMVLVLVVPVRMLWDALVVAGRFLKDTVVRPVGRALLWVGQAVFVWPWVALWRYVAVPVGKAIGWLGNVLLVVPAVWVYRSVLTPIGHGITWVAGGVVWLVRAAVTGLRLALYWTGRVLLVLPALAVWRGVLAPIGRGLAVVGREVWAALGHAWRIAGYVSLAVGRCLATLFRWIFMEPVRWVYRTVLTPVGHMVRDAIWRPAVEAVRGVGRAARQLLAAARESARKARADVRRMLFGEPAERQPVGARERVGRETRTLGSSTTALTKD